MRSKIFGIDFGTSSIKIYKKNDGIVFSQKNIIAISRGKKVLAIGDEAFEMFGKAPDDIAVTWPVKNGVIADIASMLALLNHALSQIAKSTGKISGAEFIVAAPTDITEVEKRAFFDLVASSSVKPNRIRIVEKPIADALGAGLDVTNAHGVMTVNIGADTTEVSIMSLGGIVLSKLIPVGGNKIDEALIGCVKKKYNLVIGAKTAETIKKALASAIPCKEEFIKVYGRDVVTGLPKETQISSDFVYDSTVEYLYNIVDAVRQILERTPPEISSDIIDSGVYITGGSANIKNIDQLMKKETDLNINICDDAANTVVNGLGKVIENESLSSLAFTLRQTYYGS